MNNVRHDFFYNLFIIEIIWSLSHKFTTNITFIMYQSQFKLNYWVDKLIIPSLLLLLYFSFFFWAKANRQQSCSEQKSRIIGKVFKKCSKLGLKWL